MDPQPCCGHLYTLETDSVYERWCWASDILEIAISCLCSGVTWEYTTQNELPRIYGGVSARRPTQLGNKSPANRWASSQSINTGFKGTPPTALVSTRLLASCSSPVWYSAAACHPSPTGGKAKTPFSSSYTPSYSAQQPRPVSVFELMLISFSWATSRPQRARPWSSAFRGTASSGG